MRSPDASASLHTSTIDAVDAPVNCAVGESRLMSNSLPEPTVLMIVRGSWKFLLSPQPVFVCRLSNIFPILSKIYF